MSEQRETTSTPQPPRRAVTPLKAFALVATLALAAGAILYFSINQREEPILSSEPIRTPPSPSGSLLPSEVEAKAIFDELDQLRVDAYADPLHAQLGTFIGIDSPLLTLGKREFLQLRRQQVRVKISDRKTSLSVLKVTADSMVLKQAIEQRVRFITKDGQGVTENPGWERRAIRWTLRRYSQGWKLYDSELLHTRRIT